MIEKMPFEIKDILDEQLYFKFRECGVSAAIWNVDKKPMTLKSFINRNINDPVIFPQIEVLKKYNEQLKAEVDRLNKLLDPFQKNKGKGRTKGTLKLSDEERHLVKILYYAGNSKRSIAKKYKVDEKTIRNILKG